MTRRERGEVTQADPGLHQCPTVPEIGTIFYCYCYREIWCCLHKAGTTTTGGAGGAGGAGAGVGAAPH